MNAELQYKTAIIRVYNSGSFKELSPFACSLYATFVGDTVWLEGLVSENFTFAQARAIGKLLKSLDLKYAIWEKVHKDIVTTIRKRVK